MRGGDGPSRRFDQAPPPCNAGDRCCEETAASENQHITEQFGGDPSGTYFVKVRVAGVAERYWHSGGARDQASKAFYTGGAAR